LKEGCDELSPRVIASTAVAVTGGRNLYAELGLRLHQKGEQMLNRARLLKFAVLCLSLGGHAAADYPVKPIHIVVPAAAGGSADLRVRQIAKPLAERFGVAVIVDNKPGAGGIIANAFVARARPDGYTILFTNRGTLPITGHLAPSLSYDTLRDFAPITVVLRAPPGLFVSSRHPANSVAELVTFAKKQPGKLTYGSSGIGAPQHLAGALFANMAQIDLLHVPYKGDAEMTLDLVNERITMSFGAITAALPHLKSGKLKMLAVTTRERVASFPNVPTIAESGYPDFEWINWGGFVAPAGTPPHVLAKLQQEIKAVTNTPQMQADYRDAAYEMVNSTPQEFAAFLKRDYAYLGELIRKLRLKSE
jgi:tripartite-type tricarboxylate transporter receptor subunit TctC